MSREKRPPGACGGNRAVETSSDPKRRHPDSPPPEKSKDRQRGGWPELIEVGAADIKSAGGADAAREVVFVRRGLSEAGLDAVQRAVLVRIKVGDRITAALPLDLGGAP